MTRFPFKTARVVEVRTADINGQAADRWYEWTFTVPTRDGGSREIVRKTTDLDPATDCDCETARAGNGLDSMQDPAAPIVKLTDCDCDEGYVYADTETPPVMWRDPWQGMKSNIGNF